VKRHERGLARFHIAVKMGIGTRLVKAWEDGTARPDTRQMRTLVAFLGQYRRPPLPLKSNCLPVPLDQILRSQMGSILYESDPTAKEARIFLLSFEVIT
jgi:hypothetical protein